MREYLDTMTYAERAALDAHLVTIAWLCVLALALLATLWVACGGLEATARWCYAQRDAIVAAWRGEG